MAINENQLEAGIAAIKRLESTMSTFRSMLLTPGSVSPIFVQRVPLRNSPDVPPVITLLEPRNEAQAISWAVEALTSTRLASNQHPKESLRCPGVLKVSDEVRAFADEVNQAKAGLKKVVDGIPARDRRYLYRTETRFSPTQAMRLIEAHEGLMKVTLRWYEGDGVSRIQVKTVKEQMLSELSESMGMVITERTISKTNDETLEYQVALDLERLSGIPEDEVLAMVRPVQPHIRAYLTPKKGMKGERWQGRGWYTQAPAPILTTDMVEINTDRLGDYSTGIEKAIEGGSFDREPLIKKLSLLRYVESKRSYEAPKKQSKSRMRGGNYLDVHLPEKK